MNKSGPIATVQDFIPGNPSDLRGDHSDTFDGQPGYEKGTGGKIPEVTLVTEGGFASPKPSGR